MKFCLDNLSFIGAFVAATGLVFMNAAQAQQAATPAAPAPASGATWTKLETKPYPGKQDDIVFITVDLGWYVNGAGKIYKTTDGGATWTEKFSKPGTYFRCIGFADEKRGWAGNIGTDYFPNVTDTTPLYETRDGGETWTPAPIKDADKTKGLCAIYVQKTPFINAGNLDYKTTIWAGGRVGGPACLLKSTDDGKSWAVTDMTPHCAMILDVYFTDVKTGFICAATDAQVDKSHALILRTVDAGKTWSKVYTSPRPYEITWKAAFPSPKVGYVTIQNYNPDKASGSVRYVAKTTDNGKTWRETPLADDFAVREFGVGFADENTGWVGSVASGFETRDGGKTWTKTPMGRAVNKIRVVKNPQGGGYVAYAIGVDVYKLNAPTPQESSRAGAKPAKP